jgi:hypothetical protein
VDAVDQLIEQGTVWVEPSRVMPYHTADQRGKLAALTESMRRTGWTGRPIVAHPVDGGYQAWTASHRLAAAIAAKLPTVPVFVVDMTRSANATYQLTGLWFGDYGSNPVARLMELDA